MIFDYWLLIFLASRAFIKYKAVYFRAKKGKNEEWPAGYGMKNEICDNQNIFDIYNLCKSVIICGQKEYSG